MAQIKISALTTGTPQGTDETPAVDTTDTTQAASGTTKKYIRSSELNFYLEAQGLTTYAAVLAASTTALTVTYSNGASGVGATLTNAGAQIALTLDGVTLAVADRVLIKNQASTFQNGIYVVTTVGTGATNWVLTRATDYDQAAEIIQYGVVLVNQGTVSAGLLYQETGAGPWTIGTTPITFAQYSAGSPSNAVLLNPTANQTISGAFNLIMSTGSMVAPTMLPGNLSLTANTISSINTNGNVNVIPNGTGSLLIATSTAPISGAAGVQLARIGSSCQYYSMAYANSANIQGQFVGGKSRSTTVGVFVPVQSGDRLTTYVGYGDDGTQFSPAGRAGFDVDGAVSAGIVPGLFRVLTANASGVETQALTINSSQVLALTNALLPASGGLGTATPPSAGQIPIGTSGNIYTPAAINSGTGIVVANGSGSITVSATGGGLGFATISGTTQTAAVLTRYLALNSGQTTLTLPTTYAVGDIVALIGSTANTGGWIVQAAAGDTVRVNNSTTSAGGTVTCTAVAGQCIELVCDVANVSWVMTSTSSVLLTTA